MQDPFFNEDEYQDDWYCKDCEHGPIGIEKDDCPVCGSTWISQNDGVGDVSDEVSYEEMQDKEYGNQGVEGIYNWEDWN
jgi:hypothetical protein